MANETVTDRPQPPEPEPRSSRRPGPAPESRSRPGSQVGTQVGSQPEAVPDPDPDLDPDSDPALKPQVMPEPEDPLLEAAPVPDTDPTGRRRGLPARAALAVSRSFVRDMVTFFSVPVAKVRRRHLMAIPATIICVVLIGVLWILEMIRPAGLAFVQDIAGVRQGEPLWQLLPQLPLSLFAPAPDLPAWGAMTQVLVAFGIAECWLGWPRMIGIAMITSAVTSMAARMMVYSANWLHIGNPPIDNFQVDTGPSVAVVALLIYLALRLRTYWVVALTAVSMGGEAAILPNLAGREHLVAISLGIVTYFLLDRWWPAWQRRKIERATRD